MRGRGEVSARCQRKTPNHRCRSLPEPQSSQGLGEALLQPCLMNTGAGEVLRVSMPHTGVSSRLVPGDVTESLYCLPLGRSVLPPFPRSDNRIQSKDASQILMLTVRTSYAHRPPPPAIKSHFCTSCMVCCIPSIGISGKMRYRQPEQQSPESKAGRKF